MVQLKYFKLMARQISKDIITEMPDLILYDDLALYAKLIVRFLVENKQNRRFLSKKLNIKVTDIKQFPKFAAYATTLPSLPNIYPIYPMKNNENNENKLVYVSLGTIFNAEVDVFKMLIDAFSSEELQSEQLDVLIVTGELVLKTWKN